MVIVPLIVYSNASFHLLASPFCFSLFFLSPLSFLFTSIVIKHICGKHWTIFSLFYFALL